MSELKKFRIIYKLEGYSFIVLLFVAMPLKYVLGFAVATKIAGMLHGLLFMVFVYQLFVAKQQTPFSNKESMFYFIMSLVPFGSFYTEKMYVKKEVVTVSAN